MKNPLSINGPYVQLGSYPDLLFMQDYKARFQIEIEFRTRVRHFLRPVLKDATAVESQEYFNGINFDVEFGYNKKTMQVFLQRYHFLLLPPSYSLEIVRSDGGKYHAQIQKGDQAPNGTKVIPVSGLEKFYAARGFGFKVSLTSENIRLRRSLALLAPSLIASLKLWSVPRIASERALDQRLLKFIRRQVAQRVPALESNRLELKRWVAGHRGPERYKKFWTATKRHQTVCLWGASKTSDLFIYHPQGKYGLPHRGISFEVKYVPRGDSYADAIATVAGQLLAYSLRHSRTIGFVFAEQRRPHKAPPAAMHRDRHRQLLRRLPANATLIVRFRRK